MKRCLSDKGTNNRIEFSQEHTLSFPPLWPFNQKKTDETQQQPSDLTAELLQTAALTCQVENK